TLAKKLGIPIFMTGATHNAWKRSLRDETGEAPQLNCLEVFSSGRDFHIGDIAVTPFTIPHDAADPVGFTFRAEGTKIAFATDLGYVPQNICHHLRGCEYDGAAAYVVLAHLSESNNHPELARSAAEKALATRQTLLSNHVVLASQTEPIQPICL